MVRALLTTPAVAAAVVGAAVAQGPAPAPVTAFAHVAVIPMEDTNQVLLDQTVVVRGNRIVALGPAATTKIPVGASRIDGRGKYLIPGLADMHTHVGLGDRATRTIIERELFLLAANGVTTIRNVNYYDGNPAFDDGRPDTAVLSARQRAAAGKIWSPRIYASSAYRLTTPVGQSIMQALQGYQAAGYDFIKLHGETGAHLDSIAKAAHLLGIPFMGHVDDSIPHALAIHYASIEHLTGYPGGGTSPGDGRNLADTVRLPELIAATQRAGVWNTPTQSLYEHWDTDPETWPERRYGFLTRSPRRADSLTVIWEKFRHRIIKGLQDAGAGLLSGTDEPMLVPGFGLHRELQALVRSGLTPYQALATSTRNVAAYFGHLADEGTLTVGKRADLVLLMGNPLENITNTMSPAGVMVNGRWLSRLVIDRRLAIIAAAQDSIEKAETLRRP